MGKIIQLERGRNQEGLVLSILFRTFKIHPGARAHDTLRFSEPSFLFRLPSLQTPRSGLIWTGS